jgi:hypothetical protein
MSSTALIETLSISSSMDGRTRAVSPTTASTAASSELKDATSVAAPAGRASSPIGAVTTAQADQPRWG